MFGKQEVQLSDESENASHSIADSYKSWQNFRNPCNAVLEKRFDKKKFMGQTNGLTDGLTDRHR